MESVKVKKIEILDEVKKLDSLEKIKKLVEEMSFDTTKVLRKGNRSASIRARKHAQQVKELIKVFRKEILEEMKLHDASN